MSFRIGDLSNPQPAKPADGEVDLTSFAALTTQVDAPAMSDMLSHAITNGPVSLPDAVALSTAAYLDIVMSSGPGHSPEPITTLTACRYLTAATANHSSPFTFTELTTTLTEPQVTAGPDTDSPDRP